MKKKKIIVLGFMGSCPIAGVIWQHIHYIVGLQRLGHEVFYVEFYGKGEGLIGFSTLEEIVEAVRSIRADYKKHSRAALEIAREFFEAEKVLKSLLERAGV